jgi:prominin 1
MYIFIYSFVTLFYFIQLAAEFGKAFIYQVNCYLDYVINNTLTKVGKCGPISNAYNATIVSGCNKILDPFVSIIYFYYFMGS